MTTMRKYLCTSVRGNLLFATMAVSLWVAPTSNAHDPDERPIGGEVTRRCGHYSARGQSYYSNCNTSIDPWIEWNSHETVGIVHRGFCVPRNTMVPLGPTDEVEFLISVGLSRKFLTA